MKIKIYCKTCQKNLCISCEMEHNEILNSKEQNKEEKSEKKKSKMNMWKKNQKKFQK